MESLSLRRWGGPLFFEGGGGGGAGAVGQFPQVWGLNRASAFYYPGPVFDF